MVHRLQNDNLNYHKKKNSIKNYKDDEFKYDKNK